MEIVSNKEEMIFKSEYNDKPVYRIGLTKKDKEGKYIKGYMTVNFKKGVELDNMTKIKIKNAWLDFYKVDVKTIPVIFISDFEVVDQEQKKDPFEEFGDSIKSDFDTGEQIQITDADLSMFDNENIDTSLELPF